MRLGCRGEGGAYLHATSNWQPVRVRITHSPNTLTHTNPRAAKTKKAWWEKGTKQLKNVTPVWDPWDMTPTLRLNSAESHARDQEIGFWRNQAVFAHARAQSAWRALDRDIPGLCQTSDSSGRYTFDPGGSHSNGQRRPATAHPLGRSVSTSRRTEHEPVTLRDGIDGSGFYGGRYILPPAARPRPHSASTPGRHGGGGGGGGGGGRPPLSRVSEHGGWKGARMGAGRGYSGDEDRVDEDLDSVASFIKDDDVSVSEAENGTAAWSPAKAMPEDDRRARFLPPDEGGVGDDAAARAQAKIVKLERMCAERDSLIRDLEAEVKRLDGALGEESTRAETCERGGSGEWREKDGGDGLAISDISVDSGVVNSSCSPSQGVRSTQVDKEGLEEEMRGLVFELMEERKAREQERARADAAELLCRQLQEQLDRVSRPI